MLRIRERRHDDGWKAEGCAPPVPLIEVQLDREHGKGQQNIVVQWQQTIALHHCASRGGSDRGTAIDAHAQLNALIAQLTIAIN